MKRQLIIEALAKTSSAEEVAALTGASIHYVRKVRASLLPNKPRRHTNELTRAEISEIVAIYRSGHGIPRLAKQFNCYQSVIQSVLAYHGVAIRKPGEVRFLVDPLIADMNNGLSADEIAAKYQISKSAIINRLVRARRRGPVPFFRTKSMKVRLQPETYKALTPEIARQILEIVVRDNLIAAILEN